MCDAVHLFDDIVLLSRFETDIYRNIDDDSPVYGDSPLSNDSVWSDNVDNYSETPMSLTGFDRGTVFFFVAPFIEGWG